MKYVLVCMRSKSEVKKNEIYTEFNFVSMIQKKANSLESQFCLLFPKTERVMCLSLF